MWPVTTPTFSCGLTMNIATSLTPKAFWRYSVWPVSPNPCADIARLLMGAVTSTSTSPAFRSSTAASSDLMAAWADSGVDCPGSAKTFSGRQFTMLMRRGFASFALETTCVSTGLARLWMSLR